MRQFFITVPDELIEAGKIDGCSHLRIYLQLVFPLAASVTATLFIFTFLQNWNDIFLQALHHPAGAVAFHDGKRRPVAPDYGGGIRFHDPGADCIHIRAEKIHGQPVYVWPEITAEE